jgi:polyisoprenoid-binding protein YceI
MKKFIFSAAMLAATFATSISTSFAQTVWNVDASHSAVRFTVPHLMVSEVEGNFKKFTGKITAKDVNFTDAKVEFSVDVNTINTDDEGRDKHLKSDDFFAADKYPTMTFKSTSFKKVKGNKYLVEGDLTVRNVTKHIKLTATYGGTVKDPWGNTKAGFKAQFVIDRQQYGLSFNKTVETGGAVVGNEITVDLKFEFALAK